MRVLLPPLLMLQLLVLVLLLPPFLLPPSRESVPLPLPLLLRA